MNKINIYLETTPEFKATKMEVGLHDFDIHEGPIFDIIYYNEVGLPIDRRQVPMGKDDFQNWEKKTTAQEDIDYVKQKLLINENKKEVVIKKQITEEITEEIITPPSEGL